MAVGSFAPATVSTLSKAASLESLMELLLQHASLDAVS